MTIEDQFLSTEARRVAVGAGGEPEVEANTTLGLRKRQPAAPWERPNPFECEDFKQDFRQSWEERLSQFDVCPGCLDLLSATTNLQRPL